LGLDERGREGRRERGQEYRGRRERRGGGETEDVVVLVLIVVDKGLGFRV